MIGTQLDKYDVLEKVGEGGMATVYLGRHQTLGRSVAIKVLHPHLSSSTRNRKRFAREARAIEHLRHENILEIFDYSGVEHDDCYIITEFVPGETLSDLREQHGRLPSEIAAMVGIDLAKALDYAHQRQVLHRDLKPENVMVRTDGTVKLMDFGIARFLDESQVTMTGALVGSPAYMSPEQAAELPLDARSDIFALGTLLFYVVTGHRPFSGSNPSLILKNIIEGNRPSCLELAPTMSADLADIIERCMSSEREERFQSARDVADALTRALSETAVPREDARWCLGAFLSDAAAYERRLHDHLITVLVDRGRAHLDAGDHLQALRLFNRLLSMDEDNEEVLELVQGLHLTPGASPEQTRGRRVRTLLGVLLLFLSTGGLLAWFTWTKNQQPEKTLVPAQTRDAPDISPEPDPVPVLPVEEPPSSDLSLSDPPTPSPEPLPRVAPVPIPKFRLPTGGTIDLPVRPAPAPDEPAFLKVIANSPADIFADGEKVGTTRPARYLELQPGSHKIKISSELFRETIREVDLAPGERKELAVTLQPRQTTLTIDPSWSTDCTIYVNDQLLGTVEELGGAVTISQPDRAHKVTLDCAGERHERTWAFLIEDATFGPR